MKRLDSEALEEIALGATVLGTGGGGDPTLGKLMAQQAVARHGTIEMVTPTLYGVSATPMALADEKGNRTLLETPDNFWTERISRAVTVQMGGSASIALYAMKGATAKKALIPGSLSLERSIGQTLLAC